VNRLLACLCLITINGCFYKAEPDTGHLRFYENTLPDITLTRRVVPEVGYAKREIYGKLNTVRVESKSRFGGPDEEPDLSCIHTGMREALPSIKIIPTNNFWEQIDASQNTVELTELFATPQSEWLRMLQADVLVIAYHSRIDLSYVMMEGVFEGIYDDTDRETASIVVVDLNRKMIIHGSSISFEDHDSFAHVFWIVPMIMSSREPFDICNKVAHQAGTTIVEAMPDRAIRALVVVAAKNPALAADDRAWQDLHSVDPLQVQEELLRQAKQGDADAQLALFKSMRHQNSKEALRWLCKSADQGNLDARHTLGSIYEQGGWRHGFMWLGRNYLLAYMWYSLGGQMDEKMLHSFADRYLSDAELSEAKILLREWAPGQCERDLGLVSYTE